MNGLLTSVTRATQEVEGSAELGGAGVHFGSQTFFHLGPIPVSASIFSAWIVIAIMLLFVWGTTRSMRLVPGRWQNLGEILVQSLNGVIEQTAGRRGRTFAPVVFASFMFILFANWIGITPFFGNIRGLVSPNRDLNITAAMAVVVFVIVQVFAIRNLGVGGYLREFVVPNPLHLLSELSRPLSLSLRLFGNIFAGSTLVHQILGLAPIATFVFLGLELFVGLVQSLIFTMLTMVYLAIATTPHGHGAHDDGHAASHH
ncbi:MAG: F0F1 ATP synthase subunit A [Chloroflexi bacterium]|nr:F0F1 ATP synthase subunit A [Chloroflexota bacterium]